MLDSPAPSTVDQPASALEAELHTTLPAVEQPAGDIPPRAVSQPATAGRPSARRRRRLVLSAWAVRLTGLVTVLGYLAAVAVEPAPDGPQPVLPWWAGAVATVTMVVMLASWLALAAGRRSGLRLAAIAGAGLITQSALCPAVDHHVIAGWWWAQLGLTIGITVLATAVLAATTTARSPR
jgi:hypothetical protein